MRRPHRVSNPAAEERSEAEKGNGERARVPFFENTSLEMLQRM